MATLSSGLCIFVVCSMKSKHCEGMRMRLGRMLEGVRGGAEVREHFLVLFVLPFSPPPAGVANGQTLRVPVGHSEAYIIIKVCQCDVVLFLGPHFSFCHLGVK